MIRVPTVVEINYYLSSKREHTILNHNKVLFLLVPCHALLPVKQVFYVLLIALVFM